jgi:cysteine dioxygenase
MNLESEGAMALRYAIDDWLRRIQAIPEKEFTLPRIEDFVRTYPVDAESLEPYLFYSKASYTRNLILKCELFEIMAICWDVGQMSRIHNHRDQNCWMTVPIGRLRVRNFRVEGKDHVSGTCQLAPTEEYDMHPENPGVVRPEEPVHQVLNLEEFGARATSIHIYSFPYASCEVYWLEKGRYADVPLHYTSEYGRLSPDEKLV